MKHILLCLVYAALSFVYQTQSANTVLFYSTFPVATLYYGALSIPWVHKNYMYNVREQTIPKFTFLWRSYYHIVLLAPVKNASFVSVLLLLLVFLWKDICFLIRHAEQRLKAIDTAIYDSELSKTFRLAHLHYNTFQSDVTNRKHQYMFHTNKLVVCRHSYVSEEVQNGIKNYADYRLKHIMAPKLQSQDEKKMWKASSYRYIFVEQRDFYIVLPLVFILGGILYFTLTKMNYLLHINAILLAGDVATYILCSTVQNDAVVDLLYMLGACLVLLPSVSAAYQ